MRAVGRVLLYVCACLLVFVVNASQPSEGLQLDVIGRRQLEPLVREESVSFIDHEIITDAPQSQAARASATSTTIPDDRHEEGEPTLCQFRHGSLKVSAMAHSRNGMLVYSTLESLRGYVYLYNFKSNQLQQTVFRIPPNKTVVHISCSRGLAATVLLNDGTLFVSRNAINGFVQIFRGIESALVSGNGDELLLATTLKNPFFALRHLVARPVASIVVAIIILTLMFVSSLFPKAEFKGFAWAAVSVILFEFARRLIQMLSGCYAKTDQLVVVGSNKACFKKKYGQYTIFKEAALKKAELIHRMYRFKDAEFAKPARPYNAARITYQPPGEEGDPEFEPEQDDLIRCFLGENNHHAIYTISNTYTRDVNALHEAAKAEHNEVQTSPSINWALVIADVGFNSFTIIRPNGSSITTFAVSNVILNKSING